MTQRFKHANAAQIVLYFRKLNIFSRPLEKNSFSQWTRNTFYFNIGVNVCRCVQSVGVISRINFYSEHGLNTASPAQWPLTLLSVKLNIKTIVSNMSSGRLTNIWLDPDSTECMKGVYFWCIGGCLSFENMVRKNRYKRAPPKYSKRAIRVFDVTNR